MKRVWVVKFEQENFARLKSAAKFEQHKKRVRNIDWQTFYTYSFFSISNEYMTLWKYDCLISKIMKECIRWQKGPYCKYASNINVKMCLIFKLFCQPRASTQGVGIDWRVTKNFF